MSTKLSHSVGLSVAAHAAALALAIIIASPLVRFEVPAVSTGVFTLVPADRSDASNHTSDAPTIKLPAIPKPVRSIAPPTTTRSDQLRPVSPPKPVVQTKAPTSQITFADYTQHYRPKPSSSPKNPAAGPPRIKMEPLVLAPETRSSSSSVNAESEDAFVGQLIRSLRSAYVSAGREDQQLACRIEFTLRPDGRVQSSRILNSSGNRLFDDAVLSALTRIGVSKPPESLLGTPIRTTFQIRP